MAISCPIVLSWTSWRVSKLFLFKGNYSFGEKPEVTGCQIWAVGGWVTWVIWCSAKKLCMRRDAWVGALSWWSCQSPVAHSCSLLYHMNSFHGGMLKFNAKFYADLLLYLLSHFECNGHTVHMLTQWHLPPPQTSTVKLFVHMCAFQSTLLGCQVTSVLCKLFSLY